MNIAEEMKFEEMFGRLSAEVHEFARENGAWKLAVSNDESMVLAAKTAIVMQTLSEVMVEVRRVQDENTRNLMVAMKLADVVILVTDLAAYLKINLGREITTTHLGGTAVLKNVQNKRF